MGICGNYFSGKSIISRIIANKLDIYTIIQTDTMRILLSELNKDPVIKTPTYMLDRDSFRKQIDIISSYTIDVSKKLMERGEYHVIEGIHFNIELVNYIKKYGKLIYIRNTLKIADRIKLKTITRYKLRHMDGNYYSVEEIRDVSKTMYIRYLENIRDIDDYIERICENNYDYKVVIDKDNPPWIASSEILSLRD